MPMNKTKLKETSLEYYHMTCIRKTKHTSLRGLLLRRLVALGQVQHTWLYSGQDNL